MRMSEGFTLFGGGAGRKRRREDAPGPTSGAAAHTSTHTSTRTDSTTVDAPPTAAGHNIATPHSSTTGSAITGAGDVSRVRFAELGVSKWLVDSARALKITDATPIQAAAIPAILKGSDGIGAAQTGSGKTAAFAVPILQALAEDPYGIFGLVLTPTRELAVQIAEQFTAFGAPLRVRVSVVVGGMDLVKQALELDARPHIVVATPGRLAHHLTASATPPSLRRLRFLVLDEADRLLEESFRPDLLTILEAAAPSLERKPPRQTLLFSATITPDVKQLPPQLQLRPGYFLADVTPADLTASITVSTLKQHYVLIPAAIKNAYLPYILELLLTPPKSDAAGDDRRGGRAGASAKHGKGSKGTVAASRKKARGTSAAKLAAELDDEEGEADDVVGKARSAIVFTSTCRSAQLMAEMLNQLGIECAPLHSVMPQAKRIASLARFKSQLVRVLVATDVASRGLDIPTVDLVLNFDIPAVPSDYVHRVGRTARAGRGGHAVSFVTQYDVELLKAIEADVLHGKKLDALPGVDEEKVLTKLTKVAAAYHVSKSKLAEGGFDDAIEIHKERNQAARERSRSAMAKDSAP